MKEKYFKIKKEHAARAGLDSTLRTEADEDHLLLSEKDIKMISLTVEEKIAAIGGSEYTEEEQKRKKQFKNKKNGSK
jgi:hypothetical protein